MSRNVGSLILAVLLSLVLDSQSSFARGNGWNVAGFGFGGSCDLTKFKNESGVSTAEAVFSQAERHEDKKDLCKAAQAYAEAKKMAEVRSALHESASYRLAKALFKDQEYDATITAAREYIAAYPDGEKSEEMHYLVAVSYYSDRGTALTDQEWTQKAQAHLSVYLKKYPEGQYAAEATKMIEVSYNEQAYKEIEVAKHYVKKGKHLSAALRLQHLFETYKSSSHVPEGLYLMLGCYTVLERFEDIPAILEILQTKFADSNWARMAQQQYGRR